MNDFLVQLEWIRRSKPHLTTGAWSMLLAETLVGPLGHERHVDVVRRFFATTMVH